MGSLPCDYNNLGRFHRNAGRIHSGTPVVITSVPLVGFTGICNNPQRLYQMAFGSSFHKFRYCQL